MVRHTDTVIIVMKKTVFVHRALDTGGRPCQARLPGKDLSWSGIRGAQGESSPRELAGFLRKAMSDTGQFNK